MTAVPPRPAVGDPDFPYMLADTPEEFERVRGIGVPAAPGATAGDGLREARRVARDHAVEVRLSDGTPAFTMGSWTCSCGARGANGSHGHADHVGQCVEAALRDVLAAAARDAEAVATVRGLHAPVVNWGERECEACSTVCGDNECLGIVPWPCKTIQALDGTP